MYAKEYSADASNGPPTALARVRITSVARPSCQDTSDANFEITEPAYAGKLKLPRRLNFGRVAVGGTKTKPLVIKNKSRTESLRVTVNAAPAPFAVTSGGGTVVIPPRGSHTAMVSFSPVAPGTYKLTMTVHSSDPRKPVAAVKLKGTAR